MFGFMIMGKELLADLNLAIFKIWLDTRPKMEMHDPNVYPTILGGVSRGFWSPFLAVGARSAIFWHLKTGTFGSGGRPLHLCLKIHTSVNFTCAPFVQQ